MDGAGAAPCCPGSVGRVESFGTGRSGGPWQRRQGEKQEIAEGSEVQRAGGLGGDSVPPEATAARTARAHT